MIPIKSEALQLLNLNQVPAKPSDGLPYQVLEFDRR